MSTEVTKQSLNILNLPRELRDQIWTACLMLEDGVFVSVLENGSFFCNHPTHITPALLRVNQQIKGEARAILFGKNTFSIELSKESCVRWMWKSTFRKQFYQITRLRVIVRLRQDPGSERLSERAISARQQNMKWFKELKNDIEVLLGWLQTSSSVRYLTISLCINGTTSESNCPQILRTFEGWTGLTEVAVIGAPRIFAMDLKRTMEKQIRPNAIVLERSRQKNECQRASA